MFVLHLRYSKRVLDSLHEKLGEVSMAVEKYGVVICHNLEWFTNPCTFDHVHPLITGENALMLAFISQFAQNLYYLGENCALEQEKISQLKLGSS